MTTPFAATVGNISRPKRISAIKAQQLISEKLQREDAMGVASDDEDADPSVQFCVDESESDLEDGEICVDSDDEEIDIPVVKDNNNNKKRAGNGKGPKENKKGKCNNLICKKDRKVPARSRKASTAAETQDESLASDVEVTKKVKENSPTSPIDQITDEDVDIDAEPAQEVKEQAPYVDNEQVGTDASTEGIAIVE